MNGLKQYENEVTALLECPQEEKEFYLRSMRDSFAPFTDQMTYEQLVDKLGMPEEWVSNVLEASGNSLYVQGLKDKAKRKKRLILVVAIVALLMIGIFICFIVINDRTRSYGGVYGEITVISEEIDIDIAK